MALIVSINWWIEHILWRNGYNKRPWRQGKLGVKVYEKNNKAIVLIPTIEIQPPFICSQSKAVDDYFTELKKLLTGLNNKFKLTDIFLPGGGTIPIPEWFSDWCKQNGIKIHLVNYNEGNPFDEVDGIENISTQIKPNPLQEQEDEKKLIEKYSKKPR